MKHKDHQTFVDAIHTKHLVEVTFRKKQDSQWTTRTCIPTDFGPYGNSSADHYHLHMESSGGTHPVGLETWQIHSIVVLQRTFAPSAVGTYSWHLPRAW